MSNSKKQQIWGKINGADLTWPAVIRICKACEAINVDPARVFFRAEESNAKNPIAWIVKGLKGPDWYALKSVSAEYQYRVFEDWRKAVWTKSKNKGTPTQLKDIFSMMSGK